ncbi:N-acetyl-anhydromuranmyl-L-alanine amidase [Massilia sp. Root418]|uniref:1,6-anhydro-N-acetylmuramyl-L-alanine amidase AmpD n=1 Tax=Massilia sp. Root418 TaxID=1736532 RepID=UPI0006F2B096|nr:1,6-anhydro-N-acetylmuramyl-L-alanine amidase AmpD [Massilia sp. Root418]KQW96381.1 N-acetyl-anhydromuranmyl-L-alanine amidase [Massilia sp. Root418]
MNYAIGADGWLASSDGQGGARYDSPYFNARPDGATVELLVVHNISLPAGRFGGPHVSDLFTGRVDYNADPSFADLCGLAVSAHFFVRRDGRLVQYVSCNDRAWHAGVSSFQGRPNCNDFSVGVELEGSDNVAFSPVQYLVLAALAAALQKRYPLQYVTGHEHIAPGRKTDPGPCFDWAELDRLLKEKAAQNGGLVLAIPLRPER